MLKFCPRRVQRHTGPPNMAQKLIGGGGRHAVEGRFQEMGSFFMQSCDVVWRSTKIYMPIGINGLREPDFIFTSAGEKRLIHPCAE